MEVIIFLFIIFYIIRKKNISNNNITNVLTNADFQRIVKIKTTSKQTFYTAIKNGENYIIGYINNLREPTKYDLEDLAKEMKKIHYHCGILISNNINIYKFKKEAEKLGIEVKTSRELKKIERKYNSQKTAISNKREEKYNVYTKENQVEENPIKEAKGTSILSNLFKKPDRL